MVDHLISICYRHQEQMVHHLFLVSLFRAVIRLVRHHMLPEAHHAASGARGKRGNL